MARPRQWRGRRISVVSLPVTASAFCWLNTRVTASPEKTVLWGRSLGSGVAAELLLRQRAAAAILATPYTSIAAVAEHKSIPLLPRLFVWDNFNTHAKAADITAPVLLIGAAKDTLTPVSMTEELARKFPSAQTIILPRANHFNFQAHLTSAHWRQIIEFARR